MIEMTFCDTRAIRRSAVPVLFLALVSACSVVSSPDEAPDEASDGPRVHPAGKKPEGWKKDPGTSTTDAGSSTNDAGTSTSDASSASDASGSSGSEVDACMLPGMTTAAFVPYGSIPATDEGATSAMTLPFGFTFFGAVHSQYWVTTNGELGFGTTVAPTPFAQVRCPLPDAGITAPTLFAYAVDLRAGSVCMATTGAAPNRKLVVTWKDMSFYELSNGGDSHVTFSAVLHEGTNAIEVLVQRVEVYSPYLPPESFEQGAWSVVGLQSGARAVSYSCQENMAPEGSHFRYAP